MHMERVKRIKEKKAELDDMTQSMEKIMEKREKYLRKFQKGKGKCTKFYDQMKHQEESTPGDVDNI